MSLVSCNWETQEFNGDTKKIEFNVLTESADICEDTDVLAIIFKLVTNVNGSVNYEYVRCEELKLCSGSLLLDRKSVV